MTALFADISGFTTLADTLDVESLHDVINPLIRDLTGIAEQYGGFVEKYAGDAMLVLYGAPIAHEDDPQRALLAALEMHAALPRLLAGVGSQAAGLTIHIGVNTGRVVGGRVGSEQQSDYAVLGDAVILAQRLESVCPPGQTYVGSMTRDLTREEFDFESVGELQLKGKLKPVAGFRLIGPRRADSSVARALVGRDAEMAAVERALDAVAAGARGVLVVSGDPGAGKSRLLAEARDSATRRGLQWLPARCLSYGAAIPYWPLVDLLRQSLRIRPEDAPEAVAARLESGLPGETVAAAGRLLGLGGAARTPEQARREVHDAVAVWLGRFAARSPTVLLVEDVHWADPATIDVLAEVLRTLRDVPLLVAVSARPEGRPLVDQLAGDSPQWRVEVTALDEPAVAGLVEAVLGSPASPALVALLTARTSGNALFAQELVHSLRETGALVETSQGWATVPGWDVEQVPTTVERVFAARLDVLAPSAANLLQVTAVLGRRVGLSLLRAVAEGEVDQPLEVLVANGLLVTGLDNDEPAVVFHHALLQDVVYGRLLRKRRRELHRRAADVGRGIFGDGDDNVDLLARHLYLAEAGEEAVEPLMRAGRRAASLWANAEAVVHLERALEVVVGLDEDEPRRTDVELELAGLYQVQGRHDRAAELYDAVRRRDDLPQAWAGSMAAHRAAADYDGVLALFADAAQRFDPRAASSVPVWAECANTLSVMGRFSDAVSMLRTQLRLRSPDEGILRAQLLTQLAYAEAELRLHRDAAAHADAAVELLENAGDLRQLVTALRVAGATHTYAGNRAEARLRLERGMVTAERIGLLVEAAGCLLNSGLLVLEESPAEAAARYRGALAQFERIGHRAGQVQASGNLAEALYHLGELEQAERLAARTLEQATQIGHRLTVADVTWTKAKVDVARGSFSRAAELAEQAAELFLDLDDVEAASSCLLLAAEAADAAGDSDTARSLVERAASVRRG